MRLIFLHEVGNVLRSFDRTNTQTFVTRLTRIAILILLFLPLNHIQRPFNQHFQWNSSRNIQHFCHSLVTRNVAFSVIRVLNKVLDCRSMIVEDIRVDEFHEPVFHAVSFDFFFCDDDHHHIVHVVGYESGIFLFFLLLPLIFIHINTAVLLRARYLVYFESLTERNEELSGDRKHSSVNLEGFVRVDCLQTFERPYIPQLDRSPIIDRTDERLLVKPADFRDWVFVSH